MACIPSSHVPLIGTRSHPRELETLESKILWQRFFKSQLASFCQSAPHSQSQIALFWDVISLHQRDHLQSPFTNLLAMIYPCFIPKYIFSNLCAMENVCRELVINLEWLSLSSTDSLLLCVCLCPFLGYGEQRLLETFPSAGEGELNMAFISH